MQFIFRRCWTTSQHSRYFFHGSRGTIVSPRLTKHHSTFPERNAIGVFTPKSAILFITTGVGLFFYFRHEKKKILQMREQERGRKSYGGSLVGGPFSLTTSDGQEFTERNLLGKWSLLYFGFTNCPDICPQELDKMTAVLETVEKEHGRVFQPIFITVDPARDTPPRISRYLKDFHSSFTGLFGSYDATKEVCKAFRVYFSTPPNSKSDGDYLVDHSIFVYLMDPRGNFVEAFGQSVPKEEIIEKIRESLEEWKS